MSRGTRNLLVVGFAVAMISVIAYSAGSGQGGCPISGACPVMKAGCGSDGCAPPAKGGDRDCSGSKECKDKDEECKDKDKDCCGSAKCQDKDKGCGGSKECKDGESKAVVNAKCPIMGGTLGDQVPAKLMRVYKGQKVGFCCGGCPSKWDALSNEEKDAKLKAVLKS